MREGLGHAWGVASVSGGVLAFRYAATLGHYTAVRAVPRVLWHYLLLALPLALALHWYCNVSGGIYRYKDFQYLYDEWHSSVTDCLGVLWQCGM